MTPYQLTYGKPFSGKMCEYSEPVLGFLQVQSSKKGDARWQWGLMCGKTVLNNMFMLLTPEGMSLTRSVRRVGIDWK